jgi:hypothetical protein
METERSEADEIILDLVWQFNYGTNKEGEIYCGGMSALEGACIYLRRKGILRDVRGGQVYKIKK